MTQTTIVRMYTFILSGFKSVDSFRKSLSSRDGKGVCWKKDSSWSTTSDLYLRRGPLFAGVGLTETDSPHPSLPVTKFIHSFIHSLIKSFIITPFILSFAPSFTHSFLNSFSYSFT